MNSDQFLSVHKPKLRWKKLELLTLIQKIPLKLVFSKQRKKC